MSIRFVFLLAVVEILLALACWTNSVPETKALTQAVAIYQRDPSANNLDRIVSEKKKAESLGKNIQIAFCVVIGTIGFIVVMRFRKASTVYD